MSFALGAVLFALGLGLSVATHEFGHLLTAKAFGMKARRYFIGFGPRIFSFHKGETEYGLKAIPAGGFVDIAGFTHLEDVEPADEARAFYTFPAWKRLVVLVAGSCTHFVIAILLLYVAAVVIGLPTDKAIVGAVAPCVQVSTDNNVTSCASGDAAKVAVPGPAAEVGLRPGDQITAVDGTPTPTYQKLLRQIRADAGKRISITYLRDGHRRTVALTPAAVRRPPLPGEPGYTPDANADAAPSNLITVGAIGVAGQLTATVGPVRGFAAAGSYFGQGVVGTFQGIGRLPSKVPRVIEALGGKQRSANGPISVVGVSQLGGDAVAAGSWLTFVALLASFNIFIGIFNLFPFLPLDGGHAAILIFERARARVARWRRRADPGHVDLGKLMPVTFALIVIVGGVSVLTLLADVVNPVANPFQ